MLIVDAHLDLAYNATRGRDVTRPAAEQPTIGDEVATVGLPDLRAGRVGLVCATIFTAPQAFDAPGDTPGYATPDEAHAQAMRQLDWYRSQRDAGRMRFVTAPAEVPAGTGQDSGTGAGAGVGAVVTSATPPPRDEPPVAGATGGAPPYRTVADVTHPHFTAPPLPAILLLENADPFRTPADVAAWFDAGLRIVGLAWKRTRMAGGTGEPAGLSPLGAEVVAAMDTLGMIHDVSHLAELAFWQLLDATDGPVMASHSNCREIVPTDRQLSDAMIRQIIKRGGVIGMNFFDKFLMPPSACGTRRCTLDDLLAHVRRVCELAGDARHVGLGTDMDGGLGRDHIPREIVTSADLPNVADALSAGGFGDADVADVMGGNWLRFFRANLPADRE